MSSAEHAARIRHSAAELLSMSHDADLQAAEFEFDNLVRRLDALVALAARAEELEERFGKRRLLLVRRAEAERDAALAQARTAGAAYEERSREVFGLEARLEAALKALRCLRPFQPKALADQYVVCVNEGDWHHLVAALAGVDEPGEETP